MILRLGHAALRVLDLEAARTFYVDVLGFVEAYREKGRLYLRGVEEFDIWTLSLIQASTPGLDHFALRVDSEEDLDRLEALHKELNVPVRRVPAGAEPGQGEALRVRTPDGHPVEFYHQMEQIPVRDEKGRVRLPMRMSHLYKGIPPLRIDHVNLR